MAFFPGFPSPPPPPPSNLGVRRHAKEGAGPPVVETAAGPAVLPYRQTLASIIAVLLSKSDQHAGRTNCRRSSASCPRTRVLPLPLIICHEISGSTWGRMWYLRPICLIGPFGLGHPYPQRPRLKIGRQETHPAHKANSIKFISPPVSGPQAPVHGPITPGRAALIKPCETQRVSWPKARWKVPNRYPSAHP